MIQIIGTFPTDFHWVSECMRVMRYTFMDWQNNSWNINEFEKHFSVIYSLVVFCKSYFFILFYGCHFVIFLLLSSLCTTSRHSITLSRLSKNLFQAPFMTRRVLLLKLLFFVTWNAPNLPVHFWTSWVPLGVWYQSRQCQAHIVYIAYNISTYVTC